MSELLIELFSEEIPARMQARASEDLARLFSNGLRERGLDFGKVTQFATPRRLALCIEDVPATSSNVREERKGPRVDAPDAALQGFLRSTGFTIEECEIRDDKKGQFYVAVIDKKGRQTSHIVAEALTEVVRNFPWPKAMRWGASRLKWVRPLHSIVAVHDGKAIDFSIDGIAASNKTRGHRFMAPKEFKVKNFDEYTEKLREHYVVLDPKGREDHIVNQAKALAKARKLNLVEDAQLLSEVAGLVEWPTVLMGSFDKAFLDVPQEALIAAMKKHQKYFSLTKGNKLVNYFLVVANLETDDDGAEIIAGNERVIRARLSDAKFFWDNDKRRSLEAMAGELDAIIFHEKLGTVSERAQRIETLAVEISEIVGADAAIVREAAMLSKADLVSETVVEAADMQGLAGQYLALNEGRDAAVAEAIGNHYKPQGPSDDVPSAPASMALALAEKLDTLVCFWAIDEKPTGSKDPFALRRAALGIIRIVLENELRLPLRKILLARGKTFALGNDGKKSLSEDKISAVVDDLLAFFADRMKVHLREKGARHDLIDAVFQLGDQDDLLMIVKRVEALQSFLATDDGENLLAGVKRAQNILSIEEKKDKRRYDQKVDQSLLSLAQEKKLDKAIGAVTGAVSKSLDAEDFAGAMAEIAKLRRPIDAFFDQVTVNDDKAKVRANRLSLLAQIRGATKSIAVFSKIEG